MALYTFGSGALFAVRGDVANSTPVKFGALQEASVEFSASSKELYGQFQFPLAVARGTSTVSISDAGLKDSKQQPIAMPPAEIIVKVQ